MKPLKRSEVPTRETWDLTLLYPNDEAFQADVERALVLVKEVAAMKGTLNTPENIVKAVETNMKAEEIFYVSSTYANLATSVDSYDTKALETEARMGAIMAQCGADLAFLESEILSQSEETISAAMKLTKGCRNYLKDLLRKKAHLLHPETEKVLAALSQPLSAPYDVYNMSKLADMKFDSFTVNGKEYPLGYSLFEDDYEYEVDTDVRRAAFKHFYDKLRQYENTTASAYNAYVTQDKIMAELRGYDTVFDYLLENQKVTRDMYDRQIDMITEKLAPHMRRYAKLLQKVHGLEEMTFADLKLAIDPEFDPRVTIDESKDYVKSALSILGEDYAEMVETAYEQRWIDFAKNQGKCTGGFCASPYGKNSYILLSWNNRMADVFTIAHELGHAGHFKACNAAQSLYDTAVSTYLVEAPSTMNELLLAQHLMKSSDDKRFRRWVLSSMIGHTYYHNFVTHLREAWYQREVYKIVSEGGSVNAAVLNDLFRKNLELFWGDAVKIPEGAELTWMRQPHYYMGLYSYTYSAGLTLATQASLRIAKEGQPAVDDWKKLLAAGSTLDPIGLGKLAGIDLTTEEALQNTIDYIGSIVDEIVALTEELDGIKPD
ncbi:MAG: oligoendopeptidase F [Lachnospiraceae bacterium]|nr:oligoendopeptidase F [Lachnospiraceae bacterium]